MRFKVEDFAEIADHRHATSRTADLEFFGGRGQPITIRQRGKSQELIHKGTNQWSIAAGSQGMINELEVEVGAQELGILEAGDWVQRGDHDRAHYGFPISRCKLHV